MTNDQIIQWAREAGFMDMDSLSAKVTDMFYHGFPRTERIHLCSDDRIENFAALVAAAEREACAQICVDMSAKPELGLEIQDRMLLAAAKRIRAMSEKGTA